MTFDELDLVFKPYSFKKVSSHAIAPKVTGMEVIHVPSGVRVFLDTKINQHKSRHEALRVLTYYLATGETEMPGMSYQYCVSPAQRVEEKNVGVRLMSLMRNTAVLNLKVQNPEEYKAVSKFLDHIEKLYI